MNLLNNVCPAVVMGPKTAGTGTSKGDIIDTAGFEGVKLICTISTTTDASVITLQAGQADVNDTGEMDVLEGTATHTATGDDGDEKALVLDIYRPTDRYIEPQVVRATQNASIASVVALKYGPRKAPVEQDSSVLSSALLVSPDEA